MVDQNINPEEFNGALGPFDSGTTDIKSFLPFQGNMPTYEPINTPSPVQRVNPNSNLDNSMYPVKDSITGLPPYTDQVPRVGKMTAEQKANAFFNYTYNQLNNYQDNDAYAKIQSYDPSANGAHRARYLAYGQKTFDKVGFNPLINNEALFNANTSILDDFSRMFTTSFFPLFGRGIIANPKSYAGLFTGDFGQDIAEAAAYEEANAIGYSSKGGVGAFLNNTLNSFAYTAGILVEAAAEEALIGAAIGSRGGVGGAGVGAGVGAGAGLLKGLFQIPKALYSMSKNGAKIMANLKNLDNVNEARTAFNASAKVVGDFLNPFDNTIKALRGGDNILENANNIGKLARAKNTFAGFYLDVRNMNMALSEARLEGGFVENNTYKQLYDEYYSKFGVAPDTEKQKEFRQTAKQAGADAVLYNSFLIFGSNKLVMPSLMKGTLMKRMTNYSEDILNLDNKAKVILTKEGFKAVEVNLKNSLKALKNPVTYGRSAAAYFKANITEGLQENFQNVIADYTQKRYTEAFYEPAKMTFDYKKGLLKDAMLSQISPEGFETFASGFVMGGYSKILTGGYELLADNYHKFVKDPKGYDNYVKGRKETAESIAKRLNKVYQNPKDFFNSRYFNYGHQVLLSKTQDSEDLTPKEAVDALDDSFITNLTTILRTGTMHHFIDNFEKLKQLTPEEVEKELSLEAGEGQKALDRIDTIIARAKRMDKRYQASLKMQSGIDLNNFKEGTDEYRKAALLNEAFEVSRANLVFMGESFDRNLERIQTVSNEVLNLVNQSDKIAASDIMALTSTDRLTNELNILQTEIESLKGVTDPSAVKQLDKVTEKVEKLRRIQTSLSALDPSEFAITVSNSILQNIDETATDEEVKKAIEENFAEKAAEMAKEIVEDVKSSTIEYLKTITGGTNEYNILMNKLSSQEGIKSIDSLVSSIIDLQKLDAEAAALASAVTALSDPEEFLEHVNRNFKWMSDMYNNRSEYFKDVVNTSIEQKEYNDLLQKLADKGIYVDLDEFAAWIEDKRNLPTQFEDAVNKRIITQDTPLYREYLDLFLELADIQKEKPAGERANADELLKGRIAEEDEKMQKELDEAKKIYDQELKQEVGYNEKEIEDLKEVAVDTSEEEKQITAMSEAAKAIEDLPLLTEEDLTTQQAFVAEAKINFNITNEEFNNKLDEVLSNPEKIKASITLSKADSDTTLLRTDPGKQFLTYRYAIPELLKEKIEELQSKVDSAKESAEVVDIDVASTEAKKRYDAKVAEITQKYENIKADLVEEYRRQGAKATDASEAKAYVKVSIDTPWDQLPEDLKADLEKMFEKYRKEKFKSEKDPARLSILKQNWLKTQGSFIEAYNTSKAGERETEEVLVAEPPTLTFKPVTPEELRTKNLEELSKLIKDMQFQYSSKTIVDAKGKTKTLTKAQLEQLNKEIRALQGYLSYRRSVADITTPEAEIVSTIEALIKDGSENVEVIKDKNGRTIGRRIKGIDYEEGEYATRVTSEKERVVKAIDPNYKAYVYNALREPIVTDPNTGQLVKKPSKIETMVKRVEILNYATEEEKVNAFIEQLKSAFGKGEIQKFGAQWKYDRLKDYFLGAEPKEFNFENVKEIVTELADKESSETGTLIDSLSRDYLAGKPIKRPSTMSEKAFKNLKEVLDKILDKAKDGKLTLVPKDILLYDPNYVSEDGKKGITGEIDLLLVDSDGNFYIVDFKTGHSGVWKNFNAQPQTIDLSEAYSWSVTDAPKLTDLDAVNWEALGYESYEEFNASYDNDIKSISVLSTEGSDKKGIINGTIKVYFEKGAGKKAVNIDVEFKKPTYVFTPEFSRRPEYATQLTFYRNLFANMTGIMPKEIRILPIETKINEEAQIESLQLASIADPESGFITIEPVDMVNELVPVTLAPSAKRAKPKADIEAKKADIEKELEKVKERKIGNTFTLGKDVRIIVNGLPGIIKKGETITIKNVSAPGKSKLTGVLSKDAPDRTHYSFDVTGFKGEIINKPGQAPVTHMLSEPELLASINAKYDELAALEEEEVEDQNIYEEYVPESYEIKDNVDKTVIYNGQIGTLVLFAHEDGDYGVETEDSIYPINTTEKTNILELGLNTIRLNPEMFNQPVINGKVYDITKQSDDVYIVNGVEYTIERYARKKGIKNLRYRANDAEINNVQKQIAEVDAKYQQLLEKSGQLSDDEKLTEGLQLVQQLAAMEYKLNFLGKKVNQLVEDNKVVISKNQDLINAIQSLPESFANSNTPEEEEEDLDDIKNKSDNSAAIQDMYDIMAESMPANFDKLITDINSLTKQDLDSFANYVNSIIPKLEQLKSEYEGKDRLTTNITNEIDVLGQLLNFITSIKTNKDGRVRKVQTAAVQREQARLQQDVDESAVQEPEPGKAARVSQQQAKQKRRRQVNSDLLQPMIYSLIVQPTIVEAEPTEEQVIDLEEINTLFENATAETLDDIYIDLIQKLSKGEINLPNSNYIDKLYKDKVKEFSTTVSAKTVQKGDILVRKNDNKIFTVTDIVDEGVEVTNESTNEKMFISNKDLKNKYLKHYMEGIKEEEVLDEVFDESDESASEETVESLEDAINDPDEVQSIVDKLSQLSKEERRSRLRKNSKCD